MIPKKLLYPLACALALVVLQAQQASAEWTLVYTQNFEADGSVHGPGVEQFNYIAAEWSISPDLGHYYNVEDPFVSGGVDPQDGGSRVFGRETVAMSGSRDPFWSVAELALGNMPAHSRVMVKFDLIIRSHPDKWRGNGAVVPYLFNLTQNGSMVLSTTFSQDPAYDQSYPDP